MYTFFKVALTLYVVSSIVDNTEETNLHRIRLNDHERRLVTLEAKVQELAKRTPYVSQVSYRG